MKIGTFQSNTIYNSSNLEFKKEKNNSLNFCGVDTFERKVLKLDKDLYIKTAKRILRCDLTKADSGRKFSEIREACGNLNDNDSNLKELEALSDDYRCEPSLKNKEKVLKCEEKILWQELENPEIGLVRNYISMHKAGISDNLMPAVKVSTINALQNTFSAYEMLGVKREENLNHIKLLENLVKNTPDDSPYSYNILRSALNIVDDITKDSSKIVKFSEKLKAKTNNEKLKINAEKLINEHCEYDETKFFNKFLSLDSSDYQKTGAIKRLAKEQSKKLTQYLPVIIKDKASPKEARRSAIWAAGKCKSDENFDLLLKIAKNKEQDLGEREMALHSLCQYLRTKKPQIQETLTDVIDEKSDFSELAQILLEKTEGKHYRKNREILELSESEKAEYKEGLNNFVVLDSPLNIQQKNYLDRGFKPFWRKLNDLGNKITNYIVNDTYTKIDKGSTGVRGFYENPEYGGEYDDSILGVTMGKGDIIFSKGLLKYETRKNTAGHELAHSIHFNCLSKEDVSTLKSLYENAKSKDKFMDFYAAMDDYEYFAQGCEAYCNIYKPHAFLLQSYDYSSMRAHTRFTLMQKDPELYNFIKDCIKKYNN